MTSVAPLVWAQTQPAGSNAALVAFLLYTMAVFALAGISSRLLRSKRFLSEYFLGSRGLGMLAATVLPEDRADGTITTVLTKPVGRLNYLIGRIVGLVIIHVVAQRFLFGILIQFRRIFRGDFFADFAFRHGFNLLRRGSIHGRGRIWNQL